MRSQPPAHSKRARSSTSTGLGATGAVSKEVNLRTERPWRMTVGCAKNHWLVRSKRRIVSEETSICYETTKGKESHVWEKENLPVARMLMLAARVPQRLPVTPDPQTSGRSSSWTAPRTRTIPANIEGGPALSGPSQAGQTRISTLSRGQQVTVQLGDGAGGMGTGVFSQKVGFGTDTSSLRTRGHCCAHKGWKELGAARGERGQGRPGSCPWALPPRPAGQGECRGRSPRGHPPAGSLQPRLALLGKVCFINIGY